jgi:hypothetical protein
MPLSRVRGTVDTRSSYHREVRWRLLLPACLLACGARTALFGSDGDETNGAPDASIDGARARDARVDATLDAAVDVGVNLDPICTVPDGGATGPSCTRALRVLSVSPSGAGCFVDVVVADGDRGTLRFDCNGGAAEATFGTHVFAGSFDRGRIDICTGTSFDYSDGCRWNSAQRIQGPLATELRFDYVESPAPGQSGCASRCSATARVLVE